MKPKWLLEPKPHNYPAAASYLSLIYPERTVSGIVNRLKQAPVTSFKAKDIVRASGLKMLSDENSHVRENIEKIKDGTEMSPVLLVRDGRGKVLIADGYHRVSAVHVHDEDLDIPAKIVDSE